MRRKAKEGSFRELFGLTQQELAKFIGVSRPMIAIDESKKKMITGAKLSLYNAMGTQYAPVKKKLELQKVNIAKWPVNPATRKVLQDQLDGFMLKRNSLSKKFDILTEECKRLTNSLLALTAMETPEAYDDASKLNFDAWKNELIEARKVALLKFPYELQVKLQLKLANLDQNITTLKAILQEHDTMTNQSLETKLSNAVHTEEGDK